MNEIQQVLLNLVGDDSRKFVFNYVDGDYHYTEDRVLLVDEVTETDVLGRTPDGVRRFKFKGIRNYKVVKNDNFQLNIPKIGHNDMFVSDKEVYIARIDLQGLINLTLNGGISKFGPYKNSDMEGYFGKYKNGKFGNFKYIPAKECFKLLNSYNHGNNN